MVGFTTGIYYDARTYERQKDSIYFLFYGIILVSYEFQTWRIRRL
jgi:hypothetical protein